MKLSELEILIDKYLAGEASEEEKLLIDQWINRPSDESKRLTPLKRSALIKSIWGNIFARIRPSEDSAPLTGKRTGIVTTLNPTKRKFMVRIAAAVLLLVMGAVITQYISGRNKNAGPVYASVTANNHEALHYTLPDGSKAYLFPGSSVQVPDNYDHSDRQIKVTGRAFFEVQHNPSKPFYVTAGALQTRVLGTSFEVNALPEQHPTVVVKTGRVAVSWGGQPLAELTLNKRLSIDVSHARPVTRIDSVNAAGLCNWWNGAFKFEQTPLPDVLRNISQWYKVPIIILGHQWQTEKVTIQIETNLSLQEAMLLLSETLGNKYKMDGQRMIIY